MKCNFLRDNKGEIVGALTPQGKKSELFDSLMNEFGSEKASELYAVAYSDDFLDVRGVSEQDTNPYSIKNFSFFASFGNPVGFLEAKKIGESNDRLPKTTQYNNTDFYTALEILPNGDKKLSIHFKHLEQNSNRGGGHAGLVFVFDKDKKINNTLVENLIPKVEKFRQDNFNKEGDTYRIKTNNPKEIAPVDVRNNQISSQQTEPTKEELLYFVTTQNREQAKLSTQQKVDLQNLIQSTPNFNKDSFVSMFYDESGLFSLSREKLEKSGIYTPYEIQKILSDVTIQQNLKQAVEGLANEEEIAYVQVEDKYKREQATITSFGKVTRLNPYIIENTLMQELGGLSREDFNKKVDELPYKIADKEQLFKEAQQYAQAEVMTEVDGELVNVKEDDFEQLLYQTAKISDDVAFIKSLNTSNITKEYEESVLDNLGIDITGLSDKLFDAQFVTSLYEFAKSPNKQNTKDLVENYNRVFEKSAQNKIIKIKQNNSLTGHVLIENTQKTEEELFEQNSLIKTGENTYIKIEKKPLEQLYQDVATHFPNIKDLKTYIQQRIKGFKNAENAEAVELYKMFFNIQDTVEEKTDLLDKKDPTKFFPKMIKERNKNSEAWKNYYSNFEINSNGVVLKNNDPITQSIISLYETQEQEEPQTKNVVPLKSPYQKINETEIIVKNAQEKNIRINDTVYELIQQQGNLSLYRQESAEKTNTNLNDYISLSESPTEIKVKKYDTENVEGFEC